MSRGKPVARHMLSWDISFRKDVWYYIVQQRETGELFWITNNGIRDENVTDRMRSKGRLFWRNAENIGVQQQKEVSIRIPIVEISRCFEFNMLLSIRTGSHSENHSKSSAQFWDGLSHNATVSHMLYVWTIQPLSFKLIVALKLFYKVQTDSKRLSSLTNYVQN